MAKNMNFRANLQIDSSFDTSTIMKGLQDVRKQMGNLSANDTIFKGVDKEFTKLEALLKTLQTQQQNVTSPAGLNAYQRTLERVRESAQKISTGMQEIARNENNAFNFKEVESYKTKLTQLQTKLENLTKNFQKAGADMKEGFQQLGFSEKDAEAAVNKLTAGDNVVNILGQEIHKRAEEYNKIKTEIEQMVTKIRTQDMPAKAVQNNIASVTNMDGTKGDKGVASNNLNAAIRQTFEEGIKNGEAFDMVLAKVNLEVTKLGITFKDTDAFVNGLKDRYTEYVNENQRLVTASNQAEQSFNLLNNEMNKVVAKQPNLIQNAVNLGSAFRQSENAITECEEEVEELNNEMNKTNQNNLNGMSENINKATNEMNNLVDAQEDSVAAQRDMNTQQTAINAAFDRMGSAVKNILSIGTAWRQVNRIIRQTFQDVQKLDNAFGSIAMVTNYQVSDLWDQYENYSEIANRLGQTTEGAIKSSALFYQQGLDTSEALSLTENTLKMATLANEDYTTATTQMTAALRGFHMEMNEGSRITDVYSELAAHAAADVQGIAYAMSKTASIANNAGMAFETTAAFLTNMIETTQEAPENIGTAMKSIIARFTELKDNVDDVDGDLQGMDFNKVDKALRSVGVALKDDTGSFRNLDEVFLELSSKWNTLTRNQQRYVATIAAGSRQQSRFIAMMENYERTLELVETAQDSAGRSDEQFAKYADTITYKVNQIKNSWEELRIGFLKSDTYNKGLGFVNSFLNELKEINPAVLLADIGIFAILGRSIVTNIVNALKQSSSEIETAFQSAVNKTKLATVFDNKIKEINKEFAEKIHITIDGDNIESFDVEKLSQSITSYNNIEKGIQKTNNKLSLYNSNLKEAQNRCEALKNLNNEQILQVGKLLKSRKDLTTAEERINLLVSEGIIKEEEKAGIVWQELNAIARNAEHIENENLLLESQKQKRVEIEALLVEQGFDIDQLKNKTNEEIALLAQQVIKEKEIHQEKLAQLQTLKNLAGGALQSTITAGLTAGITTGLSTGDWSNALTVGLGAALTSAIPSIINIATKGITFLLGPALTPTLITVIGGALILAIGKAIAYHSSAQYKVDMLQKEVDKIQSKLDEVQTKLSQKKQERDEYADEKKSLQELQKAYEDYSSKAHHTLAEQESYQETLSKYAEDFPNLIKLQNDEYEIQNSLLREQIALNDEKNKQANNEYAALQLATANLEYQEAQKEYERDRAEILGRTDRSVTDVITDASNNLSASNLGIDGLYYLYDYDRNTSEETFNDIEKDRAAIVQSIQKIKAIDEELHGELTNYFKNQGIALDFSGIIDVDDITENNFENILEQLSSVYMSDRSDFYNYLYMLMTAPTEFDKDGNPMQGFYTTIENDLLQAASDVDLDIDKLDSKLDQKTKKYSETIQNVAYDNLVKNGIDGIVADYLAKQINIKDVPLDLDVEDANAVNEWAKDYFEQISLGESFYEEVDELVEYLKSLGSISKNQLLELDDILPNYLTNDKEIDDRITSFFESYKQSIEENLADVEDTAEEVSSELSKLFNFDDMTKEEIIAITAQWSEFLGKIPEGMEETISKSMVEVKDLLQDKNNFGELFSYVDWTNLSPASMSTIKDGFIEYAKTIGEDSGEQIFNSIASKLQGSGAIQIMFASDEELQEFQDKMEETFNNIMDSADILSFTMLEEGTQLTQEELERLIEWSKEAGISFQDFYDETTHSIKNIGKLKQEYQNYTSTVSKSLNQALEAIEGTNKKNLEYYDKIKKDQADGVALTDQQKDFLEKHEDELVVIYDSWKAIKNQIAEVNALYDNGLTLLKEALDLTKERYDNLKDIYDTAIEAEKEYKKAQEQQAEKLKEIEDEISDQIIENAENEREALEKIEDAIEDIAEKTKELNEALYGTKNYLSNRDSFQNYNDKIEQLEKVADKAKKALDDPQVGDNIAELVDTYGKAIHQEMVYQQALNKRKEDEKNQILGYLQGFGSQYFTMVDGILQANYSAIDNAQMNDKLKDQIYQYLDDYNAVQKEIIEGEEKYNDLLKDMKERRKDALNDLIDLQKNTAEILKENYEQEIEDVKNKYDAIKEADDDYLSALEDAINKQRELRDKENQWSDLATKEKKLSLMQRDTSGTQQKEIIKLEQEIQNDRQQLLDNKVDDILNTLKETYEEQQKEREEELEYQEQLLEDMDFMKQAMEILQNMSSPQDYLAWLMQNDPEYQNMSELEQIQYAEEHENDFAALQAYYDLTNAHFEEYLNITAEEVSNVMQQTSDNMNEYLERSHQTVLDTVYEEQTAAQEALNEAQIALDEAYANYDQVIADGMAKLDELQQKRDEVTQSELENVEKTKTAYEESLKAVTNAGFDSIDAMTTAVDEALAKYQEAEGEYAKALNEWRTSHTKRQQEINQTITDLQTATIRYSSEGNYSGAASTQEQLSRYRGQIMSSIEYLEYNPNTGLFDLLDPDQQFNKFATGGLVDYTGPAWVDGSPTKPEAFLSAEDTARIGAAAQLLSNIPALNSSSVDNSYSSNIGDTTIEVHINVENISSEVDIDDAVKRVEDDIVQMSNSIGKSVYLNK